MKKVVLAIAIIIVMLLFVSCNIKMYGIYYAKYTPHSGTSEPVLQMLVDNMEYIEKPQLENISFENDGNNNIKMSKNSKFSYYANSNKEYIYSDYAGNYYRFDEKFDIKIGLNDKGEIIEFNCFVREDIIKSLYSNLKPIIDAQPSPLINLQWIFDIVYHKKFNQ